MTLRTCHPGEWRDEDDESRCNMIEEAGGRLQKTGQVSHVLGLSALIAMVVSLAACGVSSGEAPDGARMPVNPSLVTVLIVYLKMPMTRDYRLTERR